MSIEITKENFENEVLKSEVPVLLDFWAPWCGPCRMVAPVIDQLAEEVEGEAKVGKVNIDEQPELAQAFNVLSIPTIAVIIDGKVTAVEVGARNLEGLKQLLNSVPEQI